MIALLFSVLGMAGTYDHEPFSDSADDVLASAEGNEDNDWVEVVLDDHHISVDDDGRVTRSRWRVYQVRSAEAVDRWGSTGAGWSPWYQDQPTVRARVISPDGTVLDFDPATLVESTPGGSNPLMYSDNRTVRAPLPKVMPGSVVEEWVEWVDREPRFDAGRLIRVFVDPGKRFRATFEGPKDDLLNYAVTNLGELKPKESNRQGRHSVRFDITPPEAWKDDWVAAPLGHTRATYLTFSTVDSWQSVGTTYAGMIDEAMSSELPRAWKDQVASVEGREAKIRMAYEIARDSVRYTGMELGEKSLIPRFPAELESSGFGDCKEKSVVAVSLLEDAGIDASVVLIRSSYGAVAPNLPGIGSFDHAIFHVSPDIWLDPTSVNTPYGELPLHLHGKNALVIDEPQALKRVPSTAEAANRIVETRTVTLPLRGLGTVVEHNLASGWLKTGVRPPDRKAPKAEDYAGYIEEAYSGVPTSVLATNLDLSPGDVELTIEIEEAGMAISEGQSAQVYLAMDQWVTELPSGFFAEISDERDVGFFTHPFEHVVRWKVIVPDGMVLSTPVSDERQQFGPLSWSLTWTVGDDDSVEAEMVFGTGDGEISREALQAFQDWANGANSGHTLNWQQRAFALQAAGDVVGALAEVDRLIQKFPAEAEYRGIRAVILTKMGLRDDAVAELMAVKPQVDNKPRLAAWAGLCLMNDPLGRDSVKGLDAVGAAAQIREAREAWPEDVVVARNLGLALLFDEDGNRYTPGLPLEESLEHLDAAIALGAVGLSVDRAMLYLRTGDPRKAMSVLEDANSKSTPQYVAALTAAHGAKAALRHVQALGLTPQEAAAIYRGAAVFLLPERNYEAMAELTGAAESVAPNGVTALMHLRSYEDVEPTSPLYTLLEVYRLTNAEEPDPKAAAKWVSKRVLDADDAVGRAMGDVDTMGFGHVAYRDLMEAVSTIEVSDPKAGARVRIGQTGQADVLFVQERGSWRIRGPGEGAAETAREAVWRLERDDIKTGSVWLGWAVQQHMTQPTGSLVQDLYRRIDATNLGHLLFVGRLIAMGQTGEQVDFDTNELPESTRESAAMAVAAVLSGRPDLLDEALVWGLQVAEQSDQPFLTLRYAGLLHQAGRTEEARRAFDEAMGDGNNPTLLAGGLALRARLDGAEEPTLEVARALAARIEPSDTAANDVAWFLAFGTEADQRLGLELAMKSAAAQRKPTAAWLHTVATLQVIGGDYGGATETMRRASPVSDTGLLVAYGYVFGRLAEAAGLNEAAITHYRDTLDSAVGTDRFTTAALCEERLQALGAK